MCLSRIDKMIAYQYKGKKFGYKVFDVWDDGSLVGEYFRLDKPRPLEQWLDEKDYRRCPRKAEVESYDGSYTTGWHIYLTRKDARKNCYEGQIVKEVEFREPLVYGKQGFKPVVVAKYIKILKKKP